MSRLDHLSIHQLNVLLTLLEEGSVSGAARRLGVTQPAVSHSLRALRESLGDPLLVQGARGMVATPYGASLVGPLRRTVRELAQLLAGSAAFDLATVRRTFVVATWDALTFALLPGLIARAHAEAPGVQLDVRPVPREGSDVGLEDGSIDLVVEVRPPDRVGLKQRTLYEDSFVCLVREGHPAVGDRLDLETYLSLSHALISPQGEGTGVVDRCLAERGRTRRVALRIRYFLVAPLVVARSELVLTCPRSLAESLRGLAPLRLLAPPAELDLPPFRTQMVWHERAEQDPAHRWLREAVMSVLRR